MGCNAAASSNEILHSAARLVPDDCTRIVARQAGRYRDGSEPASVGISVKVVAWFDRRIYFNIVGLSRGVGSDQQEGRCRGREQRGSEKKCRIPGKPTVRRPAVPKCRSGRDCSGVFRLHEVSIRGAYGLTLIRLYSAKPEQLGCCSLIRRAVAGSSA